MSTIRLIAFHVVLALSAGATPALVSGQAYFLPTPGVDTITFSNIVLGSPLLITRIDLTIGNGINNDAATRSIFFDLPGGPAGFGSADAYATSGNGLVTGIQTVDAPGDGLSDRTLSVTFTSWVSGGVFVVSTDVDRLGAANTGYSQGAGGTSCNNCDNINGQDFVDGGAMTFRLWLASSDAGQLIAGPGYVDIPASQWSRTSSNDAIVTWSTEVEVDDIGTTETVPEPGSFAFIALGLAALAVGARKRMRVGRTSGLASDSRNRPA